MPQDPKPQGKLAPGDAWSGPNPLRWRILASVLIGGIMGPIDSSIVNANLPSIAGYFGSSMALAGWVQMAYLLTVGSLLLTMGRLGEIHGFRRMFTTGLAAFAAFSALCGLAPSMRVLIAARALQGAGASIFMAVTPAIITANFPPSERGRALGLNGMAVAVGLAFGPTLGGFIAENLGWRWLFYINLPIAVAAVVAAFRVLPEDRPPAPGRLDVAGAVLGFVALLAVLFLANQAEALGFRSLWFWLGAAAAAGVVWTFHRVESRHPEPTLNLGLFRSRPFNFAILAAMFNFMLQFTTVFVTPFLLQKTVGLSPEGIGLVMSASPAATLFVAPFSGALSDSIGTRWLAAIGSGLALLGTVLMTALPDAPRAVDVAWRLALIGLGTGVFQSPNSSAAMGSAPRQRIGQASGVLAATRNVGMSLGVAVASGVFTVRFAAASAAGLDSALAFVTAARQTLAVGALFAAMALVMAVASPGVKAQRPQG